MRHSTSLIIALVLLLLAGCTGQEIREEAQEASPGAEVQAQAGDESVYRAVGQEPGWTVLIDSTDLRFITDHGQTVVVKPLASVARGADGTLMVDTELGRLQVSVVEGLCVDIMSGMSFPDSVVLRLDDRELRGCGGDPLSLLVDRVWHVQKLGEKDLPEDVSITIEFQDERVFGKSACNRFMGGFVLTGESLGFTALATTMMACEPGVMELEREFLELMAAVHQHSFGSGGELILQTLQGQRIHARSE